MGGQIGGDLLLEDRARDLVDHPHAKFDRGSTESGHYLYQATTFGPRRAFNGEGAKATLVELRGDRTQTMIPPSFHPNGEQLSFTAFNPNAAAVHYDYLLRHVSFLAACTEAEVKLLEI